MKTRLNDFWTMNAMCTFVNLFVIYILFAPVISASIHRCVNYFDIQVLMMVTETETFNVDFASKCIHLFGLCFFQLPSYFDILSIFIFILSFRKNKNLTCQTRSYDFWIINAMCTFVYLFVVHFLFTPVISASIHRYVNYFDIQILMMVTETETSTSTLHHNIFTYLDYVFSATFIIYIYIYIYIYI